MTYYNTNKVLDIIKNYSHYTQAIADCKKGYASVGVAQGGIESVMPKAQGTTSDPTANEAIRQINDVGVMAQIKTDIKYLQDRLYRVTDPCDMDILDKRMSGMTIKEIAMSVKCSDKTISNRLVKIATIITQT